MCMVSLYLLAILCCHTIDWDIFLRYWCLSQLYYIINYIIINYRYCGIIICTTYVISYLTVMTTQLSITVKLSENHDD